MLRRHAISLLVAGLAPRALDRFLAESRGAALLVDARTRRLIAGSGLAVAGRFLAPPGSTLKPLVLAALVTSGRLTADESYVCPVSLRIGGRRLDCSHPPIDAPIRVETALAYSCNCFVAHMAEQFAPRELAAALARAGLEAPSGLTGGDEAGGRPEPVGAGDAQKLQALGEDHVWITAAGLANAYRLLARSAPEAVRRGLEGAVNYGTARNAQIRGAQVAGKTGSVLAPSGEQLAWFAGFMPSRDPEVVVTVMLRGRSGGGDAAPVAQRILQAYRARQL